jgi:phosphate transport system permease protein
MKRLAKWIGNGTPWVWLNAAAVSACILLVVGLLMLIGLRGIGHFWPLAVHEMVYQTRDGETVILAGQVREKETVTARRLRESGVEVAEDIDFVQRILIKTGNRDITGQDFRWILEPAIQSDNKPDSMVVLERQEWGVFIGVLIGLRQAGRLLESPDTWRDFQLSLGRAGELRDEIRDLERSRIGSVNYRLERLRLDQRGLELKGADDSASLAEIEKARALLDAEYSALEEELARLYTELRRDAVLVLRGNS